MLIKLGLIPLIIACVVLCGRTKADTTVGDFESLGHEQRVARLTALTNDTLDKIAAKNPILALKIQEYFIVALPGEKSGRGVVALLKQIAEYNNVDPQGYTIENAFAQVLSDYLAQQAPATQPATSRPS